MGSGVQWRGKHPWAIASRGRHTIGAPEAGLSLGRLLASRACLRFTRQGLTYIAHQVGPQDEETYLSILASRS